MKKTLLALLTLTLALSLSAQTSPLDFGKGPAQWWMTSEEQRAWRNVKTEAQAKDFIDLFWARRDPTPGTPRNENRLEFESRVAFADANFKEGKKRGAMTERGRVLIVLGFPKDLGSRMAGSAQQYYANETDRSLDPTGGRTLAAKDTWEYTHEAAAKFNVPKIEVVFLFDQLDGGAHRDPQRTDFTMALPNAIKSYIASPDLKTVPEWAKPPIMVIKAAPGATQEEVVTTPVQTVVTTTAYAPGPAVLPAKKAGASQLVLLQDSMSLKPQSGTDPFASLNSVTLFDRAHDLGWAVEYCTGEVLANAPPVTVALKLVAENGDSFSTDPEEYVPDSIRATPGCYLVRGALPLGDVDAGSYKLSLTLSGAATGQSYNLDREFRVQ